MSANDFFHSEETQAIKIPEQHCPYGSLEEYVKELGGKRVIKKILVANNGMAAVKGIRSIKTWLLQAFENAGCVKFVIMATDDDINGNAEYVRLADEIHKVPSGPSAMNYGNVDLIVQIAKLRNCDAVLPGWGHASENPELPRALKKAQIEFIGPYADAQYVLGDKISSTIIAQTARVPTMAWSGNGLQALEPTKKDDGSMDVESLVPDDLFTKACCVNLDDAVEKADIIGYPLMVKASEGGGGRGIRVVSRPEDLRNAYRQVGDEVVGSPIFLMRLGHRCRHLEVQIVADEYNNAIALYSRDCSIQRRHQKIIEEGPVTIATQKTLREMEAAAVRLSKSVFYKGAGTVEYLYTIDDQKFCFLELNPRLQVEHPVTESITGINLPAVQFNISLGIEMSKIPDIRIFYNRSPYSSDSIDLEKEVPRPPMGHCIACRITAENPENSFAPSGGEVKDINFQSSKDVWGYFSYQSPGNLHSFSDSQFGHIFARGCDREESRKNMLMALNELMVRGEIFNTSEYLISILKDPSFIDNSITTEWLDERIRQNLPLEKPDQLLIVQCAALHTLHRIWNDNKSAWMENMSKGRQPGDDFLSISQEIHLITNDVKFIVKGTLNGPNSHTLTLNGSTTQLEIRELKDGGFLVVMQDGSTHIVYGLQEQMQLRLIVDGKITIFTAENDPTKIRIDQQGKVLRYLVDDGSHVKAGTPFVEMEIMKQVTALKTSLDGHISHRCIEGDLVQTGDLLAELDLDDKSQIKKSSIFEGKFQEIAPVKTDYPHHKLQRALEFVRNSFQGYSYPKSVLSVLMKEAMNDLSLVNKPFTVLASQYREVVSTIRNIIPKQVYSDLLDVLAKENGKETIQTFQSLSKVVNDYTATIRESDRAEFIAKSKPIQEICENAAETTSEKFAENLLVPLIDLYSSIEDIFDQGKRLEEVMLELRELHGENIETVFNVALSHNNLKSKNAVLSKLLDVIEELKLVKTMNAHLVKLGEMRSQNYSRVVLQAKQILLRDILPAYHIMYDQMSELFEEAHKVDNESSGLNDKQLQILNPLINRSYFNFDILMSFFKNENPKIRELATEVYIRKAYSAFELSMLNISVEDISHSSIFFQFTAKDTDKHILLNKDFITGSASMDSMSSLNNLGQNDKKPLSSGLGILNVFSNIDLMKESFPQLIEQFGPSTGNNANVLHIYVELDKKKIQDEEIISEFNELIQNNSSSMQKVDIGRITFVTKLPNKLPYYYTFRRRTGYQEDPTYRHIEPTLAFQLHLEKLRNYNIEAVPIQTPSTHIYYATKRKDRKFQHPQISSRYDYLNNRFFVRMIILQGDTLIHSDEEEYKETIYINESHRYLNNALKHLELAMSDSKYGQTYCNHIFVNVLPSVIVEADLVQQMMNDFQRLYAHRLWNMKISEVEIKVNVKLSSDETDTIPLHIFATNKTGYQLTIDIYQEMEQNGVKVYQGMNKLFGFPGDNPLNNIRTNAPYSLLEPSNLKRTQAHNYNTSYVQDFPFLFERQVKRVWKEWKKLYKSTPLPANRFKCVELRLNQTQDELVEITPENSEEFPRNGMIAWKMRLATPECPNGRDIIVISNDITFMNGSFGPYEDILFDLASKLSRKLGIPRIYITANSGARIGIADEVREKFHVAWEDPQNPRKGFKYLYLRENDYESLKESVQCELIQDENEKRYKIIDIIGKAHGLGVENLRGSGLIAGETSKAYQDVFTLNYVASRTVGIGAYLVRLGQRVIQNKRPPILLTGAQALNKVLNREVYTSNNQLGGIQIMFPNGVTHSVVKDDLAGIAVMLKWLSYIPERVGAPLPIISSGDPVDRDVTFNWNSETVYDPRHMLTGLTDEHQKIHLTGLFDENSFFETLGGWAKNIVVGRARLGGIPMGVIAVDTSTISQVIPADPADDTSQERVVQKPGQVWFPDSAFKTAQAIQDFNKGEQLPLMIFANWRGFSGGQRDMYEEILKFGSYIVDALVDYKQPVFVYIPPHGELRGGAWVVVDPMINPEQMEMYADTTAKGGVLEPNGTASIKYRIRDVQNTARRLDPVYAELSKQLTSQDLTLAQQEEIEKKMEKRIKDITPAYNLIAIKFCDLHDTPGRMKRKGAINEIVPWKNSRRFFYHRLRRRLFETRAHKVLSSQFPEAARDYAERQSAIDSLVPSEIREDNAKTADFFESNVDDHLKKLSKHFEKRHIESQLEQLLKLNPELVKQYVNQS